mgnify:CR=1 FL=1
MASPYTKDITKSSAYRQVTGQDKDKFTQALEGAVQIKKAYNNKVADNIQALQDDKVIEIQKKKLMLKGLNGVSTIQNDIRDNFNSNVDAWARDYAQKELNNEAISKFGLSEVQAAEVDVAHPNSAYGKWLDQRADGIAKKYNDLVTQLDSVGLPYKDLQEGSTFIDKVYQSAFNGLERQNKFNLINSVGSLFKGHGLGNKNAAELKAEFNANIATSSISKLESINTTFKALYATDASLAADYEKALNNADLKQNVEVTKGPIETETRVDKKTGRTFKYTYQNFSTSYIDKNGKPQLSVSRVDASSDPVDVTKGQTFEGNALYLKLLRESGHAEYFNLLQDFEPYQAYMQVRPEHGKSISQAQEEAERKRLLPEIMTNWQNIQEGYYYTMLSGEMVLKPQIKAYVEDTTGKVAKPVGYYNNMNEYTKDILGIALQTELMNENLKFPNKISYPLVSGLSDSFEYRKFVSDSNTIQGIKDDLDVSIQFEEELLKEFEAGDYSNVDENGTYFLPMPERSLIETAKQSGRTLFLNAKGLTDIGLDSSDFGGAAKLGYNVKTKTLVLEALLNPKLINIVGQKEEEVTDVSNLEKSDKGWATNLLQAVNDIPYLGAVTELALGEDIDVTDALWLIPGIGLVGGGIKVALSQATKYGAKAILASSKGSAMLTKITAQYNKTKKVRDTVTRVAQSGPNKGKKIKVKSKTKFKTVPAGEFFGFTSQALYNSWYKGLSAVEKAMVNSINKTGKSVDIKKFSESLGNIRGAEFIARIPGTSRTNITNKTIVKYGTGSSAIGQVASRTFDDMDDEPID